LTFRYRRQQDFRGPSIDRLPHDHQLSQLTHGDELDFATFKARFQKVPVEEYPNRVLEAVPEPMVSVKISTYQHADFIRDCLDGVLMQETDFPIEILIGEDESTDGTREICKAYADRHPDKIRLFLHRRENNIAIHGRPTGKFQSTYTRFMCRGKYIALCEGDDYWTDPLKLQKQVEFLEANPGYVLSHHDACIIDADGHVLEQSMLRDKYKRNLSAEALCEAPHILTLSLCYRRQAYDCPPESLQVINGDTFLFCVLGITGQAKYQAEIRPAAHRQHVGGIWSMRQRVFRTEALAHTYGKLGAFFCRIGRENLALTFQKRQKRRQLKFPNSIVG